MKENKSRFILGWLLYWLPAIVTVVFAVITAIVYGTVFKGDKVTTYLLVLLCSVIPGIYSLADLKLKIETPYYLIVLISLHIIISTSLGTAFGLYNKLSWWDLLAHGLFGYLCCATLACLYVRFVGKPINWFMIIALFLMTMGVAVLWEVCEFLASTFTGSDIQRVQESIDAGRSPLFDTITDVLIAAAGVAVYFVLMLVKSFIAGREE